MELVLVNIYPVNTIAQYLISSYILKGYLEKNIGNEELNVDVLNFNETYPLKKMMEKIAYLDPDFIGYSSYIWNIETILKLIEELKGMTNALHLLGGPEIYPTRVEKFEKKQRGDFYVIGEGERTLLRLMQYLMNHQNEEILKEIKGLAYWKDEKLIYNGNGGQITNLDDIPSIYLDNIIEDRLYSRQQAFLETQRGCRFKCKYCLYHKGVQKIAYNSLDRVKREIDHLIIQKQISALRIFDSDFMSDVTRAKEIMKHLIHIKKSGIKLPWIYWEITCYDCDEEFIQLTAELKNREVIINTNNTIPLDLAQHYSDLLKDYNVINCIGLQSFHKEALNAVSRYKIDDNKFKLFMSNINKYNIVLKIDLILGLPLETFGSYFNGLGIILPYLRNTDHILNIHRLQILPGSDLERLCEKYEIKYSFNAPHTVYSTSTIDEEELNYLSKLTSVLFRIINSPLREYFFLSLERSNTCLCEFMQNILNKILEAPVFANTKIVKKQVVDEDYWNDEIFQDITSQFLSELLI